MRPLMIGLSFLVLSMTAALAAESVGQRWEESLLTHKRNGTLAWPPPWPEMPVVRAAQRLPLVHAGQVEPEPAELSWPRF